MNEYITEAFVLKSQPQLNKNRWVELYTKNLGKIKVKAISGGKITSKLAPHLDVLNLSIVRLVNKNIFLITDALTKNRFENIRKNNTFLEQALETVLIIKNITPFNVPDYDLWNYLNSSFKKNQFNNKTLLTILGYNPKLAQCSFCENKNIKYFIISEQNYACSNCANKINEDDKILIN